MWPTWQQAAGFSAALVAIAAFARSRSEGWVQSVGRFCGETAYVSFLYMLWRLAKFIPMVREGGAFARGRQVWRLERVLHFPSEVTLEKWVLNYDWLARAANVYYATLHVPALLTFLAWLFIRHRDQYRPWRNVLAMTTGACLIIRFWRVAPPRLYPDLGFVDMALRYNQSVYGPAGGGVSDQLAAMPSIHCAWAILVGVAAVRVSTSPWRWLAMVHTVLTILVVAVTANHWWLDGVVAGLLLWAAWGIDSTARKLAARWRAGQTRELEVDPPSRPEPVSATAE